MAKASEREAKNKAKEADALEPAREANARGDTKAARAALQGLPSDLPDALKSEAADLKSRLAVDPAALGVGAGVAAIIAFAATVALFLRHAS